MPKMNIKVSIHNEMENSHYKVPAIFQEDTMKYKEQDDTIVTYNYRDNILLRENKELRMKYPFDPNRQTTGEIIIKELEKTMKIKIETIKLERKNQNIEIVFKIDENQFLYKIEEVI